MTTFPAISDVRNNHLVFIAGGPKTASTSLCGLVNSHPDVFVMCEVDLNNKGMSRYGKKLVRRHPDMLAFFAGDFSDPLQAYRQVQRYLSTRGDKFALVELDNRKTILLDFAGVEFLSSAALGKLITFDRKVKTSKGRLKMCGVAPGILEVFQVTKLNKVFDIRPDAAEAMAAF